MPFPLNAEKLKKALAWLSSRLVALALLSAFLGLAAHHHDQQEMRGLNELSQQDYRNYYLEHHHSYSWWGVDFFFENGIALYVSVESLAYALRFLTRKILPHQAVTSDDQQRTDALNG